MGVWQPYRDKCSSMTKVHPKPQSEGQFLTKSIQHVFVVGPWPFQIPMLGVHVGDVQRRASMLLSAVRKRTPGNQAAPSASAVAIAERTKCDTQCCCKAVGAV